LLPFGRSPACDDRRRTPEFAAVQGALLYRLLYFSPAVGRVTGLVRLPADPASSSSWPASRAAGRPTTNCRPHQARQRRRPRRPRRALHPTWEPTKSGRADGPGRRRDHIRQSARWTGQCDGQDTSGLRPAIAKERASCPAGVWTFQCFLPARLGFSVSRIRGQVPRPAPASGNDKSMWSHCDAGIRPYNVHAGSVAVHGV
jgi:hypothetical protein